MANRIEWLYDPSAHRKQKTEAEKMNEAVDVAALAAEKPEYEEEEEHVPRDMLQKIKEDPLFTIRRTELHKRQLAVKKEEVRDERRQTRSRSPRKIPADRQQKLRELLLKASKKK